MKQFRGSLNVGDVFVKDGKIGYIRKELQDGSHEVVYFPGVLSTTKFFRKWVYPSKYYGTYKEQTRLVMRILAVELLPVVPFVVVMVLWFMGFIK